MTQTDSRNDSGGKSLDTRSRTPLLEGFEPTNRKAFTAVVARLRDADPEGRTWLAALGVFEILRIKYSDRRAGVVNETDRTVAANLGVHRETWAKYSRLLVKAGLLRRRGKFTNADNDPRAGWEIPILDELAGRVVETLDNPVRNYSGDRGVIETLERGVVDAVVETLDKHRPSTRDDARENIETKDSPLPPQSGGTESLKTQTQNRDGAEPTQRELGTNPRARGTNPRAVAKRRSEERRREREREEAERRRAEARGGPCSHGSYALECSTCRERSRRSGRVAVLEGHAALNGRSDDLEAELAAARADLAAFDGHSPGLDDAEPDARGRGDCSRCDASGFVLDADGAAIDPPVECSHDEETEAVALLERELGAVVVGDRMKLEDVTTRDYTSDGPAETCALPDRGTGRRR